MNRGQVNAHIGRRVRMERRRRNFTQKQLAQACGVTFQQIHKYEMGMVSLSAGMLWAIADALSIAVSDLFPRADGQPPPPGGELHAPN
jgi:transcriptional regulator with XRE-family HTH domain